MDNSLEMNKEELIEEYKRVDEIHTGLVKKLLTVMSDTYDDKIRNTNSLEELATIEYEILKEWPNTVSSYLMYKKVKEREKELNGSTEHN